VTADEPTERNRLARGGTVVTAAFMHLLGRWNWWALKSLAKLHERLVSTVTRTRTNEA
jgi:hypothetical protein